MGEVEQLSVRVVRELCQLMSQMFSDECKNNLSASKVSDLLDGIQTRASNARMYLSTWGPFHFLSFYFSKAAEALKSRDINQGGNVNELFAELLRAENPRVFGALNCYVVRDGTDESYLFYSFLILRYHVLRGLIEPKDTIANTMMELLDEYSKNKSEKTLRYDEFIAMVENINRLIEIYLLPLEDIKDNRLFEEIKKQCGGDDVGN